jgi:hypothetical protein
MRQTGVFVIGLIIAAAGVFFGAWWAPFPVGIAIGIVQGRGRTAIPLGALVGFLSWIVPLARLDLLYGAGPAAATVAAIMGFGRHRASLLGLTGAWLATAVRTVTPQSVIRIK